MDDETKVVSPSAPRQLTWWETAKAIFPNSRYMTREEREDFDRLTRSMKRRLYREEELKAEIAKAVRGFASFLETTTSPNGTVQREKLQSFATEFLAASIPEQEK